MNSDNERVKYALATYLVFSIGIVIAMAGLMLAGVISWFWMITIMLGYGVVSAVVLIVILVIGFLAIMTREE